MMIPVVLGRSIALLGLGLAVAASAQHEQHEEQPKSKQPARKAQPAQKQRTQETQHQDRKQDSQHNPDAKQTQHNGPENHAGEMDMAGPEGIPQQRDASGTAWQPDASPMFMHRTQLGPWMLMTHYNAFLAYDHQSGPRGDDQINSINWLMLMAQRRLGQGDLTVRGMFSLEPATTSPRGYPLLFQSGEVYSGKPLIDRQHPHDLFMELAARYRHPLRQDTALNLYFGAVGEPALGPVAFPHRVSAMDIPMAPLTHHWLDSTHITFGVFTAGIARRNLQVEGSVFTGREPDEHRWNFDRMKFDSYAGRVTFNPGKNWSGQVSHGYLKSPEQLHANENTHRTTFSLMHSAERPDGGHWATTLAYGRNLTDGNSSDGWLLESTVNMARRHTVFGRVEHVKKLGEDLGVVPDDARFGITQFTLGASHELTPNRPYETGIGAAVTFNWKPASLEPLYGRTPMGFWLFLRIRPAPMKHTSGEEH